VKKLRKLGLKKVTLRDLDSSSLDAVAGGCCPTVNGKTCICTDVTCATCTQHTCVKCGGVVHSD